MTRQDAQTAVSAAITAGTIGCVKRNQLSETGDLSGGARNPVFARRRETGIKKLTIGSGSAEAGFEYTNPRGI